MPQNWGLHFTLGNFIMHIKIYFDEKPVYLCDEIDKELNEILHHPDAVFIDEISNAALKSLLHEIVKPEFHAGVVWNNDLEKLKKAFCKKNITKNNSKNIYIKFSKLTTISKLAN